MLRVEPQHKVGEPASQGRIPDQRPHHGYGGRKRGGYADRKLRPLAEYHIISGERLQDRHDPQYDAGHPQHLVSYLVASAEVLVVHVQQRKQDHGVGAVVVYVSYVEPERHLVVYELDAVPRPVEYGLVVEHEQGSGHPEYDERDERQHAQEAERTDKPCRERELYRREYGTVYALPQPVEERDGARPSWRERYPLRQSGHSQLLRSRWR